jgi:hypothetical protein
MSADNRRAIAGLTALSVYAIAYYMGFGNWPSMALFAAVWVGMHLLMGVKMKMWG